jgi:hypothetical protein
MSSGAARWIAGYATAHSPSAPEGVEGENSKFNPIVFCVNTEALCAWHPPCAGPTETLFTMSKTDRQPLGHLRIPEFPFG